MTLEEVPVIDAVVLAEELVALYPLAGTLVLVGFPLTLELELVEFDAGQELPLFNNKSSSPTLPSPPMIKLNANADSLMNLNLLNP